MSVLTLVSDVEGDWEAVYVDGNLVEEGHSVPAFQLGEVLVGVTVDKFERFQSAFSDSGKGLATLSEYTDLESA